jgi:hypothetical protein
MQPTPLGTEQSWPWVDVHGGQDWARTRRDARAGAGRSAAPEIKAPPISLRAWEREIG